MQSLVYQMFQLKDSEMLKGDLEIFFIVIFIGEASYTELFKKQLKLVIVFYYSVNILVLANFLLFWVNGENWVVNKKMYKASGLGAKRQWMEEKILQFNLWWEPIGIKIKHM